MLPKLGQLSSQTAIRDVPSTGAATSLSLAVAGLPPNAQHVLFLHAAAVLHLCPGSTLSQTQATDPLRSQAAVDEPTDSDELDLDNLECDLNKFIKPPPLRMECCPALLDVIYILEPLCTTGYGQKVKQPFTGNHILCKRMELVCSHLSFYTESLTGKPLSWTNALLMGATSRNLSAATAQKIRQWAHNFLEDWTKLPLHRYGTWSIPFLFKGELCIDLSEHLQGLGLYICASNVVDYMDQPDVQEKHSLNHGLSISQAQHWLEMMGFHWTKAPKGQYVDGHKQEDVVNYRQNVFLPCMQELRQNCWSWTGGNLLDEEEDICPHPQQPYTVFWFHNKSTFYAHDQRET